MWAKIVQAGIVRSGNEELMAQQSKLGWLIFGAVSMVENLEPSSLAIETSAMSNLEYLISRLWEIEEVHKQKAWTKEEQACEDIFSKRHYKTMAGRYCVMLPLKDDASLGESRHTALHRLYCLESMFEKDPELKTKYVQYMKEYEEAGYMRRADKLEPEQIHYYIPHHAVLKKFRVVFDGSAKTTNGMSLNDIQMVGPKIQRDLITIMLDFRTGKVGLSADVRKMFNQVEVNRAQWDLRMLWRANRSDPITEYWITVVWFGGASSMHCSTRALIQCARDSAERYPVAAKIIEESFYVDDLLKSVEDEQIGVQCKKELIKVLGSCGFQLLKWRSNSDAIIDAEVSMCQIDAAENTTVLGTMWDFAKDELKIKIRVDELPEFLTKRIVVSRAATMFDVEWNDFYFYYNIYMCRP